MLKRVLAATDFSPNADAAVVFAADLARHASTDLLLLHVAMPSPGASVPLSVRQDYNRHVAAARRLLEERAARSAAAGRPIEILLKEGDPAQVIVATARDAHVDAIVVGTHKHKDPAALLIGSVAERVLRLAPCTVMVVKRSSSEASREAA